MFIAVVTGFAWFARCIHISACFTWTKYPDSVTRVWNGSTVALKWDYNLTADEQNAARITISRVWDRCNESHLEFVASKNFITGSPVAHKENHAPHIIISRSEEATLIINDVTKEDEAVYKFTVRFPTLGNLFTQNFTLEVREQPTLQCPETVIVTQGEPAIIPCSATGDPEPNRTWTKQSQPNIIISTNSTLVIHNVSISHGGTYNSTANNGRSASVLVELIIHFPPKMTSLTIESNPKNTTVLLNSSLTLLCVTNANPPALYHLYFNESYIGNSSSGEFNATAKGDGAYTCVPINTVGTGNDATLDIIAVVRPSIKISNKTATAVEGDRLNFTCTPFGKPEPNLAWTEVGKAGEIALTPSVSVIVGRPETPDNMIQYQCTASNGVETPATATVNVTVYYGPSAKKSSDIVDVEEGGDRSIRCLDVIGNPLAAISWYRGNAISGDNITNNPSLRVSNAAESDAGWYTCFAKNDVGNATFKVLVRVVPRTIPTTVRSTNPAPCPKTPSKNERLIGVDIEANCNESSQVATEFANKACDLLRKNNCEHGRFYHTSCDSGLAIVRVRVLFNFSEAVDAELVVSKLREEAGNFGGLKVIPKTIVQICTPSTVSTSTSTASPSEAGMLIWGIVIGVSIAFLVALFLFLWWVLKRRQCKKETTGAVSPVDEQPLSSNHSTLSDGKPCDYAMSGPQPLFGIDTEQKLGAVGGEAIPTDAVVDKSGKKDKKKNRKATEQKPVDDQHAVVDKSGKKKKNEADNNYAEVDMSKKLKKKPKPGEVLYADLGELHQMREMPEVSTSPKTLPPIKRPEAYAETQYADITQFLKGNPEDKGAELPKDSTTPAVSNTATGSRKEYSAGNTGDGAKATNETGF